ncbi:zinc finger CCCH domain-containing protein 48-like isoform X2 [Hibiscus syriacus]|uniref:zinc finger CCCH domain-containing protein 48-like isoform X2 n=1 Tax=Hibiscus syriacus TaxID=106335 RepID=UPI0019229F2B|nr:zinc finger CCCH domain-containing protein 48-like isoform X2 [Hibiscus syriacus]
MDLEGRNRRVFNRLGGPSAAPPPNATKTQKVCYHWRAGKCSRFPCPFLHRELPYPSGATSAAANGSGAPKPFADDSGFSSPAPRRGPNFNNNHNNSWGRMGDNKVVRKTEKVCNYWVQGNCNYGERCKFLHSWNLGEGFTLLNHLDGHQKCMGVLNLGGEVGCMISEGPWLFVGITNVVKAWNTQTNQEISLSGPVGQVYSMVVGNDLLFAGTQDGTILVWKFNAVTNSFEPAASLKGHTLAVVSLVVGANRLYSGSMDHSIKAWSLETLQCLQTLTEHTNVVMSLLCWEQFLLSCSLDKTIKVWVATENGNLEVTFTHNEEHGLLNLRGMPDSESKPVLLCACNDNSVRLYDLPSFSEKGKIFAKQEIRAIEVGPGGLFFTGDGTGFRVWKWVEPVPKP